MRKQPVTVALKFAFIILMGGGGAARAQPDLVRVQRFEDPTPSLASEDAQSLQEALSTILDRLKTSSGSSVTFPDQQRRNAFLDDVARRIGKAHRGRTPQTILIGQTALQIIDQIRAMGPGPAAPRVDSDLLVQLAQQTANLLATVVFEGPRIPIMASPQGVAPSPSLQVPSKSLPPTGPVGYGAAIDQAGPY